MNLPDPSGNFPSEAIKGRGASANLKNRFEVAEYGYEDSVEWADPENSRPRTQFWQDQSKSILSENKSPDVGIEASINPYRGCEHGCIYCYARPTHEYLGLSSGLDFETKILVKHQAPQLLQQTLAAKTWIPKTVTLSGVTDAYQPVERMLKLTRRCLEVLLDFRNPAFIITKNFLVTRDIDLFKQMHQYHGIGVMLSVTSLDNDLCGILEPRTARPEKRLEAIEMLATAGIPVGVNLAPIIPGLTEHEMPDILKLSYKKGARFAGYVPLRLPYGLKDLFTSWLSQHYPERKNKILSRLADIRGGKLNDSRFGTRMKGEGVFAEQLSLQFKVWTKKLGYQKGPILSTTAFKRPIQPGENYLLEY